MTRDYKNVSEQKTKQKKAATKTKSKNSSESLPVWFWLVSGVVIGAFVSFLIYLKLNVNVDEKPALIKDTVVNPIDKKTTIKETEDQKEEKDRFEFYSILPKREVDVPVEELDKKPIEQKPEVVKQRPVTKEAPVRKEQPTRLYVLQVGSFQRFKDADKRKANLAFIGVASKIHAITRSNKTMYRVQIGPYNSINKINEISSLLKQNNIPSLLMKVKG